MYWLPRASYLSCFLLISSHISSLFFEEKKISAYFYRLWRAQPKTFFL